MMDFVINVNIKDVCVDAFYWFDKSTKRKDKLVEYFKFCDQEYQSVLKHLSVDGFHYSAVWYDFLRNFQVYVRIL